ncbi:RluA family pseudouridine synthase [Ruminiclostridium sufflavum DSM 19573]|uniref:Pseudouridine synthase n=1 Tax=Ruminiclostridium sufflavum DSM 19573 TaxID=1121337 RepID=A0A318XT78_9FIRM|nr:RluA family pseudouridine synthase [Ruminiclostridium sufflavum]PYG89892.1 RluA family pseudouridine synthase [Ruminiclostridium sufflavum DSM 19573]
MILEHTIDKDDAGKSVRAVLKSRLQLSTRFLNKLKLQNKILINDVPVKVNYIVKERDVLKAELELDENCENIEPQDIPIDIIFEDECLIVLNKQSGIVVHPTFNHPDHTIANGIVYYLKQKGISKKVRPVSRLDRETSGIIIFAKNQFAQDMLIKQMQEKVFEKEYSGIVQGIPGRSSGTIDLPIGRKPESIMLRWISESGAPSITHYEVAESFPAYNTALLKFKLETGRTHQIRVHCQAMGFPIYGDTLYSENSDFMLSRQALHSHTTKILHPETKKQLIFNAELPEDMKRLLEIMRH